MFGICRRKEYRKWLSVIHAKEQGEKGESH